jgi:hypothetical protein
MDPYINSFHCPLCHSIDAVTKVSSIVDGGSATSVGYHATGRSYGTSVTTSTTALARKLSPPSLPRPPIAAAGSVGFGAALLLGVGLFMAGVGYWMITTPGSTGPGSGFLFLVPGLGFIAYLLLAVIVTAIIRQKKRPGWQRAIEIWDHLYYCARNDVVFLPGSSPERAVSSSQMTKLLYP